MTKLKRKSKMLHDKNFTKWGLDLNKVVTGIVFVAIILFILIVFSMDEKAYEYTELLKKQILESSMFFMTTTNLLVIACIGILISPLGKIRIGGKEAKAEFSNLSWYSMLFSAGMGIGLLFYGVAEPLFHLNETPLFPGASATDASLATVYFNWGIHAWAIYAIMALAFAFFAFNMGLPLSPRSLFYPIVKDKIFGIFGDVIDGISIILTLFALAASLGLGSMQITDGLNYLFGANLAQNAQIVVIILITFAATLSVVSGLSKGVRILSELNIKLMFVFVVAMFLVGPTLEIIESIISSTMTYIGGIVPASSNVFTVDRGWAGTWPIFYMAWWMSWSIFVGMFIAKISKGRTFREFILVVILVPTAFSIIWFSTLGTTGFFGNELSDGGLLSIVNVDMSSALFALNKFIINSPIVLVVMQITAIMLVVNFFITSSDSGSLIVDGLASGGKTKAPKGQKIFWACLEGALAIIFLVVGGANALNFIQAILIIVAFPFCFIIFGNIFTSLYSYIKYYRKNLK